MTGWLLSSTVLVGVVLLLRRVKFGPLEMGELKRGEWRELTEKEIEMLREL